MEFKYKQHGWYWDGNKKRPKMFIVVDEDEIELYIKNNRTNLRSSAMTHIRKIKEYFSIDYKTYCKLTEKCQICNFCLFVDLHHIIPISEGGTNDIKNLICLCKNCHCMIHMKGYTLNELEELYEQKKYFKK